MTTLAVVCGVGLIGGIAALARFLLDAAVSVRVGGEFPAGTFLVNVSGAFGLGIAVGLGVTGPTLALAGTGLIGSYTTFSTWMLESQRLAEEGSNHPAFLNICVSLLGGLASAVAGYLLGSLV
jgi:CrcB protein